MTTATSTPTRWVRHCALARSLAVAAVVMIAVLLSAPATAGATVPAWQHPRTDPTLGCVLTPDPGSSSGGQFYPAGDDDITVVTDTTSPLNLLANDCTNSTPGSHRVISVGYAVPAAIFGKGATRGDAIGSLHVAGDVVTFTPHPGWTGDAAFQYQWVEDGQENDSAFSGSYDHRYSTLATVTLHVEPATSSSSTVPAWQHPRTDPTAGCPLQPDPGGSGNALYPAGDDAFTVVADTATVLDLLANDCANSTPGSHRVIDVGYALPLDEFEHDPGVRNKGHAIGNLHVVGDVVTFTPHPGWTGQAAFQYQWVEDGQENDSAFSGPYDHRYSTLATVTLTIQAAPQAPASARPTSAASNSAAVLAAATNGATARHAQNSQSGGLVTVATRLAATGSAPTHVAGLAGGLLLIGGAATVAGSRRRRHTAFGAKKAAPPST